MGHLGFTVGAAWAAATAARRPDAVDYRAIAVAALAPDALDRMLFIFLPYAQTGRSIGHTLTFHLVLLATVLVVRPRWWPYPLASAFHIVLDSVGWNAAWSAHVLWPWRGSAAAFLSLQGARAGLPYGEMVVSRLAQVWKPYAASTWLDWGLEIGGALVLLVFSRRQDPLPRSGAAASPRRGQPRAETTVRPH